MLEHLLRPDRRGERTHERSDRTRADHARRRPHLRVGRRGQRSLGTYDSSYAYPDTHYVEVNGTAGRVQSSDTVKRFTRSISGSETREVWEAGYFNDPDRDFHHLFERHLDDLIPALRAGDEPPIHARAGRRALELAVACIRSFEESRQVPLAGTAVRVTGGGSARPEGSGAARQSSGWARRRPAVARIRVPATPSRSAARAILS